MRAFNEQHDPLNITPWDSNETVAGGLADPFPWDGDAALKYLKLADGKAVAVSDDAIEESLVALGKFEGIFAEPSGVAAVAGLRELMDQGVIDASDHVVVPITGQALSVTVTLTS